MATSVVDPGSGFRESLWLGLPNRHGESGLWVSRYVTKLEGVSLMLVGAWCGQLGVGGWILMGLFWATFLGLVLWAVSRLFGPARMTEGLHADGLGGDTDDLDLRLERGELDISEYQRLRAELVSSVRN